MQTLWNQYRYKSKIRCLIDVPIREYDITKANISVLRDQDLISESMYQRLFDANKLDREIEIGKMISSNPGVSTALSSGIIQAKKIFFENNGIEDDEILEIDNDAIFIIGDRPITAQQVKSHIFFRLDQRFTSFYDVNHIRYFYYLNRIQRQEYLNPKGLGSEGIKLHSPYMLDFLKELFYTAQSDGITRAIELLAGFYSMYIERKLDIGYYRELNSQSHFSIIPFSDNYSYSTDVITAELLRYLNISCNEIVLREFNRLLFFEYTKGRK